MTEEEVQDHDLSDVVIPDHPPAPKIWTAQAEREWLSELHDLYGAPEVDGDKIADYREAVDQGKPGHTELKAILADGWTLGEVAEAIEVPVLDLCRQLWPSAHPRVILRIEKQLRAGATSQTAVARLLRCSQQLVGRVSAATGVAAHAKAAQSHDDELVAEVLQLRSQGHSYGQIATEVGLSRGQAQGIVRRHGDAA